MHPHVSSRTLKLAWLIFFCLSAFIPSTILALSLPAAPFAGAAWGHNGTIPFTDTVQLFLPAVNRPAEPLPAKLGVDFATLARQPETVNQDFPLAAAMGATWIRVELPWAIIEPNRDEFHFEMYDSIVGKADTLKMSILGIINYWPAYAASTVCGPIDDHAAFETYLRTLITHYRDQVDAWEFANEPDAKDPTAVPPGGGCYARYPEEYSQELALFYRLVKELDPDTPVVFGSLAYDGWQVFDRDFLAHVLPFGAGRYFDILGLHYYPINLEEFPTVSSKIDEVRTVLERFQVWNKPIWITETAAWTNPPDSVESQRNFVVSEQTRGFCDGADNLFWFGVRQEFDTVPLHRWLINLNHEPDQAYSTYQFYARKVTGLACQGRYAYTPANAEAYLFKHADGQLMYIVWANQDTATVSLPAAAGATLTARDGGDTPLAADNGKVAFSVGRAPVYITLNR